MECSGESLGIAPSHAHFPTPADTPERVLYARLPGLRCAAVRAARGLPPGCPIVVSGQRMVLDACVHALAAGISVGMTIPRARRRAPLLTVVPEEECNPLRLSARFRDVFARLSPVVEPVGADAVLVDVAGAPVDERVDAIDRAYEVLPLAERQTLRWAVGTSRWSARLAAESEGNFALAPATELWPEDPGIGARLVRLGAFTCGQIAALGEDALVYALGRRTGRPLWRRACGFDTDPLRPLWPPPVIDVSRDCSVEPLENSAAVDAGLVLLVHEAASRLGAIGRHARRVALRIATEAGPRDSQWRVPLPVGTVSELATAVARLRERLTINSPVTGLRLCCHDLDLAPARVLSLFDGDRTADGALAVGRVHLLLSERYGHASLRRLAEIPLSRRDRRRALRIAAGVVG